MFVARRPACRSPGRLTSLLAHRLSPGAIEWLRDRGANWADEAVQARILGPSGLIVIRDTARPLGEEGVPRRFTWSRSAIIIAETILVHRDQPRRATDPAKPQGGLCHRPRPQGLRPPGLDHQAGHRTRTYSPQGTRRR